MTIVNAFEVAPATSTSSPKNETLIHFVLDETGSMSWCADATISSFNEYLGTQRTVNDGNTCRVSLTKFSDTGRVIRTPNQTGANVRVVYESKDVHSAPQLTRQTYQPNGGTNLYDAIGATIAKLDASVKENQNVLVVIMTDGEENASREYNAQQIKALVEQRQAKGWTFVYLGANQDAWKVGSTFGLSKGQTLSYNVADMKSTMDTLSMATTSYRSARGINAEHNLSGTVATSFFDQEAK